MKSASLLLACFLFLSLPVYAQEAQEADETCTAEEFQLADADTQAEPASPPPQTRAQPSGVTDRTPATSVSPTTEAESFVQDRIAKDGIHVVHFWAPWCSNSTNELEEGWGDLVTSNPKVTFTFVTVWNDDESGASTLERYDLPDRVLEVTQPDLGPSDNEAVRRRSFLSLPISWIPSTWVFHQNGELAFALNYGEMEMQTIQSLLDATEKDW